ncbi:MAG: PQQ-binding-like beta-propeller repeat protein [Candidatus Lokiarchaeota archaeon]|nr:PQQ-binding-like beta-propeller repeat protein [Candidatus Lokiarchaeota archaeon]
MVLDAFIERIKRLRTRNKIRILIILLLISFNLVMIPQLFFNNNFLAPHDVDRKSNGNTLICAVSLNEMFAHPPRVRNQIPMPINSANNRIIEINARGTITWEISGLAMPHEVEELPSGNLLVADTTFDRVIEIDYDTKEIIWSWEPSKINWTEVNEEWDENHYYNNPKTYDWTHINDVDFKKYGSWNACLVSLRNFDLVVELNYTAESISANNASNILWWYGDYENTTLLSRQHNPDYLENGNVIIADSENDRIVEVNYSTKEKVWESAIELRWPRDADELDNGNLLITDSYNNRIIEINRTTQEIVWMFERDLMIPYESDQLENGNYLISTEYMGKVIEVNQKGFIVWSYGFPVFKLLFYFNSFILIGIAGIEIFYKTQNLSDPKLSKKKTALNFVALGVSIFIIVLFLIVIFHFNGLLQRFLQFIYPSIKGSVF